MNWKVLISEILKSRMSVIIIMAFLMVSPAFVITYFYHGLFAWVICMALYIGALYAMTKILDIFVVG